MNYYYSLRVAILLLGWSGVAAAASSFYIETVVFAQQGYTSERLGETRLRFDWPANLSEVANDGGSSLGWAYKRLLGGSDFQPLLHQYWVQSIDANARGPAVHVHSLGSSGAGMSAGGSRVNGYVRLQRGQTLVLTVAMQYTDPTVKRTEFSDEASRTEAYAYRIYENRRVRYKEIHYFDHPRFGVLVRVNPVEQGGAVTEPKVSIDDDVVAETR